MLIADPVPGARGIDRDPGVSVSVVVPALNEAQNIAWVLARLPAYVSEVVLVDGLSTDRTEAVARAAWPDITVVHQYRRGKGAALRAGFAAATGDIVVMLDADGSTDPREMPRFIGALLDGADLVKGSRHLPQGGSADSTLVRRAGNQVFVGLANVLYRTRFTDLCYGYCAFWRRHLDALALRADGFEIETELILGALGAGLEIWEVPSYERCRRAGVSNLNAVTDGRRVLKTLLLAKRGRGGRGPNSLPAGSPLRLDGRRVAAPDSEEWRPAGRERRRGERRQLDRAASGYTGPERRRGERRAPPAATRMVYVASPRERARAQLSLVPPAPGAVPPEGTSRARRAERRASTGR
jgi:hypothetical protein